MLAIQFYSVLAFSIITLLSQYNAHGFLLNNTKARSVSFASPYGAVENQFKASPDTFLATVSNPVITFFLSRPTNPIVPTNGNQYAFGFQVHDENGYRLVAKSINPNDPDGFKALWLDTNNRVEFSDGQAPIFVTTQELQGCSLYIRRNRERNTITLYHHNRRIDSDTPGNRYATCDNAGCKVEQDGITEIFDDLFAWEKYWGLPFDVDPCTVCNDGVNRQAGFTVFLYKDPRNDQWTFMGHRICYTIPFINHDEPGVPRNVVHRGLTAQHVDWRLGK